MAIQCTKAIKGETDGWQALAEAIVVQAVKDYRTWGRMIRRIEKKLCRLADSLTPEERICLEVRCQYYKRLQKNEKAFFQSKLFSTVYDLDGSEIFARMESEVAS